MHLPPVILWCLDSVYCCERLIALKLSYPFIIGSNLFVEIKVQDFLLRSFMMLGFVFLIALSHN